ncbi:tail fiber assembly protein [Yersinia enterocolitica]|uniref:tail fiber assembly protein n=1 Tax=Yersinia enterocolitica TaxID=630 RepID=UPI0029AD7610|nr:tail fiber assembly protein [Yersinia enterocolitica]HEI6777843.1 tail fiber assembly protein [Yersinia enterocolitica]HEI6840698.1 tail fiber assembly protein [Yersinia enterocolitica]HEI6878514.1 tail fiber assembly protein [Yersinia enterocolitica]HEI6913230.1 tail fiber assembly protein [Yersinia enterocolitica]
MTFKFANHTRTLKVYNFRSDTQEFIGAGDAHIPPRMGLPANCTTIAPPDAPEGQIAVFDLERESWSLVDDHRGLRVYHTDNGQAMLITDLGPLPENCTQQAPNSSFDRWKGSRWVKDEEAEKRHHLAEAEQKKRVLLNEASTKIQILQDSIELGLATETTEAELLAWRKYRVLLDRVDISTAPNITWPAKPE